MRFLSATLTVLLLTLSNSAVATVCPLAMITFVDGGIASASHPNVIKIKDSFEETFGPSYPLTLVESARELQTFEFALALSIDNRAGTLTVNVRDILTNSVLNTESVNYRNGSSVEQVLESLARKIKEDSLNKGLVGACHR